MRARRMMLRLLVGVLGAMGVILSLPGVALCVRLLRIAEEPRSAMVAWACLSLLAALFLAWLAFYLRRRRVVLGTALGMFLVSAALWMACVVRTPDGRPTAGRGVSSVFTGELRYARCSLANLVAEIDQHKLGSYLLPRMDPHLDRVQARRLRRLFLGVYGEMSRDAAFVRLGSVMDLAYREILLGRVSAGHFYEYIPPASGTNGPRPVVLFLHGSLGNFKGYLWALKALADRRGVAIIAPTFGAGNWDREGGVDAVRDAVRYCRNHPGLDGRDITLVGLSNGSRGVTRAAAAEPSAFARLIYISPVMETRLLDRDEFLTAWRGRRVLILHGTEDRRIPVDTVEKASVLLEDAGLRVEAVFYEAEDHFLFFSQRDCIMEDISNWLDLEGV